tara:strand:+ start:2164 stop:2655 length:492 start_codon:yes stop_codon:yes gene_type:complete
MDTDKIMDRLQLLELHVKDKKNDISKGMKDMILSTISEARNVADDEMKLNSFWNTVKSQNKLLGEKAVIWSGQPSLPIAINAGVQEQATKVRPFLIDSFQLVDPLYLRGRGGRVLTAEQFADMIIDSANRRLETEYNNGTWDGNFPITLTEVEEETTDNGGTV